MIDLLIAAIGAIAVISGAALLLALMAGAIWFVVKLNDWIYDHQVWGTVLLLVALWLVITAIIFLSRMS